MKVTLTQENLTKALGIVSRSASGRATLPVLANILIQAHGDTLLLASTNLEIASTCRIGAKIEQPGEITVPARLIQEFVANLPKKPVTLTLESTALTITCEGYSSTINGIVASEFPDLPEIDDKASIHYQLASQEFKQAMNQVLFACSHDVSRPILTGVYWHSHDGTLYVAATDGYRLAERKLIPTESELAVVIPQSTLQEVSRILSDDDKELDILFDETQVRFRTQTAEITSRLIDGKYPDYRQLIPAATEIEVELPTSELSRTAKIAGLFTRESGGSVTIDVDEDTQSFSIRSVASEIGENTSRITTKVTQGGSVSLNSRYLSEVLAVISEETLTLGFSGKLAPIKIIPNNSALNYTHIIMPLKS